MKVVVYGTLKRDFSNNKVMTIGAEGEFIKAERIEGWQMHSLGPFPAVVPKVNSYISGEIWEVQDIDALDSLEGFPSFYNRMKTKTSLGPAWIYYMSELDDPVVYSGSWDKR